MTGVRPHVTGTGKLNAHDAATREEPEEVVEQLLRERGARIDDLTRKLVPFGDERLKSLLGVCWRQMSSDVKPIAAKAQIAFHAVEEVLIRRRVHGSRADDGTTPNTERERRSDARPHWDDNIPIQTLTRWRAAWTIFPWAMHTQLWAWDDLTYDRRGPVIRTLHGPTVTKFDGSDFRDPASERHFPEIDMAATL